MRKLALITIFAALLQNAGAQRMGASPHFGSPNFGSPHFGAANLGAGYFSPQRTGAFSHSFPYGVPFFSDGLYSDSVYPAYGAQPAIIVMQAPLAAEPEHLAPPAQPLLIELQGDRYVRLSGDDTSGAQIIDGESVREGKALTGAAHPIPAREPISTLLVFRDGHREEVSDYTITDGVLYAHGDYYADGASNQKVALSALNLPETVASNRSRGVAFRLPRAANEVIIGP
jgi:hypothetical protein